jgi:hypothetical protein
MNQTKKNKIICYTGMNARKNGKHTPKNYGNITRKMYPNSRCKKMKNYPDGKKCPKRNNTNAWVEFLGAEYTSPEGCDAIIKHNKEEDKLLEKINKCKTRKCADLDKERMKEQETFQKEQDKSCPQKSPNAFYECSTRFYEKSKYKRLFDKFVECGKNKCAKERRTLALQA